MEHDGTASQAYSMLAESVYDDPSLLSQLLQQRALPEPTSGPSIDTTNSPFPVPPAAPQESDPPSTTDPSPRAFTSRRVRPHNAPPRLSKSETAPVTTGVVKEAGVKMFQSYAGPFDAPGDTQPDSQMFRNYTSILSNASEVVSVLEETGTGAGAADPQPDRPDDGGSSLPSEHHGADTSPTVVHIEDEAPGAQEETQDQFEPTSPLGFVTPARPQKRKESQVTVLSSAKTSATPGTALTAAFFGGDAAPLGGPTMSLTQIFNTTQVGTSPMVNMPPSDPVFQRPSPNFNASARHSPPRVAESPSRSINPSRLRGTTEPRDEYVTMKESQQLREQDLDSDDDDIQDSWDEPTEAEKQAARRRAKEKMEEQARKSYATVTAPSRESPRSSGRKKTYLLSSSPKYKTHAALKTSRRMPVLEAGHRVDESDEESSPDELSRSIDVDSDSSDELSQPNLSSVQSKASTIKGRTKNYANVQVPHTSSHPEKILSGRTVRNTSPSASPSSQLHRESQGRLTRVPGSQPFKPVPRQSRKRNMEAFIADSQPEITEDTDNMLPSRPPVLQSSPVANKYNMSPTHKKSGFTSQVSSSMPPAPPSSSSLLSSSIVPEDPEPDPPVPSSPPIATGNVLNKDSADEEIAIGKDQRGASDTLAESAREDSPSPRNELPETQGNAEETAGSSHANGKDTPVQKISFVRSTGPQHSTIQDSENIEDSDMEGENTPKAVSTSAGHVLSSIEQINHAHPFKPPPGPAPENTRPESNSRSSQVVPLSRIANAPDTQQSVDLINLELPDFGFGSGEMAEIDEILTGSSPVNPRTKRRKIVYSSKRTFLSPTKTPGKLPQRILSSPLKRVEFLRPHTPASSEKQAGASNTDDEDFAVFAKPAVLRSGRLPRSIRTQSNSSTKLKRISSSLLRRSNGSNGRSPRMPEIAETPVRPDESSKTPKDVEMTDSPVQPPRDAGPPSRESQNAIRSVEGDHDPPESPSKEILNPNRVFALWPNDRFYYPATCIARRSRKVYMIQTDDGNVLEMEAQHIRPLDLAIGEQVKVNLPGMKKKYYVVVGFKDRITTLTEANEYTTDCHGYVTVVLEVKRRDSLPNKGSTGPAERVSVPINSVYLTPSLWNKLQARKFQFGSEDMPSSSPEVIAGPSAYLTPKRTFATTSSVTTSLRRDAVHRATSVDSSVRAAGIFSNMLFGVTFAKGTSHKETITDLILKNGGQVLDDGFEVLFEKSSPTPAKATVAASSKSGKGKSKDSTLPPENEEEVLTIKEQYRDIGFVALITDDHYRRQKYIEALALNLPCLHYRWLLDSARVGEALPFPNYLLPAGASAFLDPIKKVVRSRTLVPYDPTSEEARFENVLGRRDKLLDGQTVLFVAGKGRDEDERISPYLFLTNALGARKVSRCTDLNAAHTLLASGDWDLVYVGDKEGAVEEAESVLFDSGGGKRKSLPNKSKKRKRESSVDAAVVMVRYGVVGEKRVGIIGNEFVVQSLILGDLISEE